MENIETVEQPSAALRGTGIGRLAVGLLQGFVLYLLYRAGDARSWPATDPMLFAPLLLVALFVPLIMAHGLGALRLRTLILWALAATIILAVLGLHDRARAWLTDSSYPVTGIDPLILPAFRVFFFASAGLFIAHSLIGAADFDRKWIARYVTYFDVAWKNAIQLALSFVFVCVLWGVLWLGAGLFDLIGLKFLSELYKHAWFAIPVTTLAVAAALHLTDVRSRLVSGIRGVLLALLSWLLPLLAILAGGFLVGLLFTGLDPLWNTRSAAALLLVAAAALVILINAAAQDGVDPPPLVLRWSAAAAGLILVPVVALAGYAIALRVSQYGWTESRIGAAACLLVAAIYALGYAAAVVMSRGRVWMETLHRTNVVNAFVVIAVLLALFTPLADPARLAVASQVARLKAGTIPPNRFDFGWLRFSAGSYGRQALTELKALPGPAMADVRKRAGDALRLAAPINAIALPLDEVASQVTVYPRDRLLPPSLLRQDWWRDSTAGVPNCLVFRHDKCEAFFAELNGDTRDEIVFVSRGAPHWQATVLSQNAEGSWYVAGSLPKIHCGGALDALRAGQYRVVAPTLPTWRSIDAGDTRLDMRPPPQYGEPDCE